MKKVVLISPPSAKSATTATTSTTSATTSATTDDDRSENRDSCYFPKCRKDANCNCEMCLASINATLDLIPKSSLTNFSASKRDPKSPVPYNSSVTSTPGSSTRRVPVSPPLNSTARTSFHDKMRRKKRDLGLGFMVTRLVLGLSLIFLAESGLSWVALGILRPEFSPDTVRNLSEKSWILQDVNEKLEFFQRELQSSTNGKVSNCSTNQSLWKINQDDLLLNSYCSLYKSATEEVRIWGWPLQSSGLLTAEFSSRSLIILSGRVTEWSDGKVNYSIRKDNKTWMLQKWSASVVQLDPNTWILEYKWAGAARISRIVSALIEFLKFRLSREVRRMKQEFWLLPSHGNRHYEFKEDTFKIPT